MSSEKINLNVIMIIIVMIMTSSIPASTQSSNNVPNKRLVPKLFLSHTGRKIIQSAFCHTRP